MRPRRTSIGKYTREARRKKQLRASQTMEERQASNEAARLRAAESRASESQEQRAARNLANRLRAARSRASESREKRAARNLADRLRAARKRALKSNGLRTVEASLHSGIGIRDYQILKLWYNEPMLFLLEKKGEANSNGINGVQTKSTADSQEVMDTVIKIEQDWPQSNDTPMSSMWQQNTEDTSDNSKRKVKNE